MRSLPLPTKTWIGHCITAPKIKAPLGSLGSSSGTPWSHSLSPLLTIPPRCRPKTYHTSLKVAWDLNTGIFVTVSVGDLTEVKGQTR